MTVVRGDARHLPLPASSVDLIDMSADYSRLARWRTTDPGQRAAAMQVDKPDPVMDGQLGLFEGAL